MTRQLLAAALATAAAVLLGSCGQPAGGGAAASSQRAASSALASSAPASDTATSSTAAAALPPVAAAPPPAPTAGPVPVRVAEKKRQPTAAELLRDDPTYQAREQRLEALYGNARERDPTGQVEQAQTAALAERRACVDRACLDAWFRRREAALRQYVEN